MNKPTLEQIAVMEPSELDYWVAVRWLEQTGPVNSGAWTLDPYLHQAEIRGDKCFLIPRNPMRAEPLEYSPSTNPAQNYPIQLRERILVSPNTRNTWSALPYLSDQPVMDGPTPLIAICRAYLVACRDQL